METVVPGTQKPEDQPWAQSSSFPLAAPTRVALLLPPCALGSGRRTPNTWWLGQPLLITFYSLLRPQAGMSDACCVGQEGPVLTTLLQGNWGTALVHESSWEKWFHQRNMDLVGVTRFDIVLEKLKNISLPGCAGGPALPSSLLSCGLRFLFFLSTGKLHMYLLACACTQSCPTLCPPWSGNWDPTFQAVPPKTRKKEKRRRLIKMRFQSWNLIIKTYDKNDNEHTWRIWNLKIQQNVLEDVSCTRLTTEDFLYCLQFCGLILRHI